MLTIVPHLLDKEELNIFLSDLHEASWLDGKVTAGAQSSLVKFNRQLPENSDICMRLGNYLLKKLGQTPLFLSAALPKTIYPPLFNRYEKGEHFGIHVDNAIRPIAGTSQIIRTDLSATLFLCDPQTYEGGELVIEGQFGAQEVKLKAGDLVLYSASSLHQVMPIQSGQRLCAFFWMQSMVRDDNQRSILFDLDQSIQALSCTLGNAHSEVVRLSGIYHNLLRRWAEL